MLSKWTVIRDARRIRKCIAKASAITEDLASLGALRNCRDHALDLVLNATPTDSGTARLLRGVLLDDPIAIDENGEPFLVADPRTVATNGSESLISIIDDFILQVQNIGLPHSYKAPRRQVLFSAVLTGILSLLGGYLLARLTTNCDSGESQLQRADTLTRVAHLRSWLKEDNRDFIESLNRLSSGQQGRGIYSSGIAIQEVIDFASKWREKRDYVIDTTYARLRPLGVVTDTLRISGKLPQNMYDYLKARIKRLEIDEPLVRNLHLDTL